MLNIFPSLLDYSLFAPLILRVVGGIIIIGFGKEQRRHQKVWLPFFEMIGLKPAHIFVRIISTLEIAAGVMLIAGFATQIAASFAAVITLAALTIEYKNEALIKRDVVFYTLLLSVYLSLILTGAGIPALDLPL